ncbi:hypothetical protein [Prescottella agglutinans]|uniref:hypothetical protein n=1 Tax=Prescottella agglutinans TaxID=1644129 RepID=UPI000FDE93BD|nr:hypothetical protein [Prescottella agglutinans]
MSSDDQFRDLAGGDLGVARHLASSLRTLKQHSHDPEFSKLVDEVLSGRTQLRDVFTSDAFARTLNPLIAESAARYRELDSDTKTELAEEGERQLSLLAESDSPPKAQESSDDSDDFPTSTSILSSDW